MNSYLLALKNYAVFEGRSRRRDYWCFLLFQVLAVLVISFVERQLAIANPEILAGWVTGLYLLLTFVPALALTVRRLHDSGLAGWWLLLHFVPVVGPLVILAFTLLRSEPGSNRYGPHLLTSHLK